MTNLRAPAGLASIVAASIALMACNQNETVPPVAPPPPPPAMSGPLAPTPEPTPAASAAPTTPPAKQPVFLVKDAGLAAPESVLYDADQDVLFVSNVNGKPFDADGNGFISKLDGEGKVVALKFVDGTKAGTPLDAPKGMTIVGDVLYVADITWIRMFDRKSGAAKGKIAIKGATFLNDLSADPNGTVYVTDSGWKPGEKGFDPTGTDAVWKIAPKVVTPAPLLRDKALAGPNGIVATADGVWVDTWAGELIHLGPDGKKLASSKAPKGMLDGLVLLPDGTIAVSSWEGKAVYHGKPGGELVAVVENVESPADIGYDSKRKRLVIPQMMLNQVAAYAL